MHKKKVADEFEEFENENGYFRTPHIKISKPISITHLEPSFSLIIDENLCQWLVVNSNVAHLR